MAIITITGTPGSGKSTLAKLLSQKLGWQHYSIGDVRRKFAATKGITLIELNRLSESGEEDTDTQFDEYQKNLGEKEDHFVIDSRLGFHFIPTSIKLFVDADERVRAKRVGSREGVAEAATDTDDALQRNLERTQSDKARYLKYYNVNPFEKKHYDLVLDSTAMSPEELVEQIISYFNLKPKSL